MATHTVLIDHTAPSVSHISVAVATITPLRRTLSNTAASEHSENRSSSGLPYATQTYIRQNHVILNIAQIQHHPTFIGISCSLYISFIQANTQFVSTSTMYAMQSNANSCMPSAPLARSGSPPRCCKHLPSIHIYIYIYKYRQRWRTSRKSGARSGSPQ